MARLSVVIPTLNEEASIGGVLEEAKHALPGAELVVADSSTDRTAAIAAECAARVVRPEGAGYGTAYRAGFAAASGELLVMGDGDGTYDFREAPRLLEPLERGEADVVVGNRFTGAMERGAMPWLHRCVGSPLQNRLFRRLFGLSLHDIHSGFRALSRAALQRMELRAEGFEFATEMLICAAQLGLRVSEVEVSYRRRRGGVSKLRSFRDGWRHIRLMRRCSRGRR